MNLTIRPPAPSSASVPGYPSIETVEKSSLFVGLGTYPLTFAVKATAGFEWA
jgi:hypothetical protein